MAGALPVDGFVGWMHQWMIRFLDYLRAGLLHKPVSPGLAPRHATPRHATPRHAMLRSVPPGYSASRKALATCGPSTLAREPK